MLGTEKRMIEHVDTDASGVVHFSRYAIYFETALLNFLHSRIDNLISRKFSFHQLRVVNLQMDFIAPSQFNEIVQIDLSLTKIRKVIFQIGFTLSSVNPKTLRNKAKMTFCYVDKHNKPSRIPEFILRILGETNVCNS